MSTIPQSTGSGFGHERKDADVFSLVMIIGALFLCGALIFIAISVMMHALSVRRTTSQMPPPSTVRARQDFPEPRLQVRPSADFAKLHAREQTELNSYGWVDKSAGVMRIPIERAMQLLVERGLPDTGGGQTPLSLMQQRPQRGETPPRQPPPKQ